MQQSAQRRYLTRVVALMNRPGEEEELVAMRARGREGWLIRAGEEALDR